MTAGAVLARIAALLVAVGLVAGALALRDGGGNGAGPDGPGATPTPPPADLTTLRCAEELGICGDLVAALPGVEIETVPGPETARQLVEEALDLPWVTLRSLTAVVADGRERAGRGDALAVGAPVATSPLVLVVWADRAGVLDEHCEQLDWACVGRVAPRSWEELGGDRAWGPVKPAHPPLDTSGVGTLVLAQAASSQLQDLAPSSRDLDDPGFQDWFTGLARAVPSLSAESHLLQMLQFGPSAGDVVGTTEAEAARLLSRAGSRAEALTVRASSPPVLAELVVAAPAGSAVSANVEEAVRTAAGAAGWRLDGPPTVDGFEPVAVDGDPVAFSGGLLEAIRLRWERVR